MLHLKSLNGSDKISIREREEMAYCENKLTEAAITWSEWLNARKLRNVAKIKYLTHFKNMR